MAVNLAPIDAGIYVSGYSGPQTLSTVNTSLSGVGEQVCGSYVLQ